MEPIEFAVGHPAHPQSESAAASAPPLLRSYSLPNPDRPQLDRQEFMTPPAEAVHEHAEHDHGPMTEPVLYTCPMHPEIVQKTPGNCPICGMRLVPKVADDATGSQP
jgi:hypothetical protein